MSRASVICAGCDLVNDCPMEFPGCMENEADKPAPRSFTIHSIHGDKPLFFFDSQE